MKTARVDHRALEARHGARNYSPLPVVISRGEGCWVEDVEGRRYLDGLAAYSALNFGHRHPVLVAAAERQLERLTLTSRAFHNDQLGPFCAELAELCAKELVLPMNTGAEAVETAIKMARKWGYERAGVPAGEAQIVVFSGNFHGRTTTIVSFSDDPAARDGFGPYAPGFVRVPYGDAAAVEEAMRAEHVVGVLVEPVQGEAGVIVPPDGFLRRIRELCTQRGALMIADEIQSGLGRSGRLFACDHEDVVPDVYLLGKALGGGIVPLSAVVADEDVLGVFGPGEHGSTFGGNPLACAIGREVLRLVAEEGLLERVRALGERLVAGLRGLASPRIRALRARGLWVGIDLDGPARPVCERALEQGVLCKEAHEATIRLAPPLVISDDEVDWLVERFGAALS